MARGKEPLTVSVVMAKIGGTITIELFKDDGTSSSVRAQHYQRMGAVVELYVSIPVYKVTSGRGELIEPVTKEEGL